MRKLWIRCSFLIVAIGLFLVGGIHSFAAEVEDENAIYSAPIVTGVLNDGTVETTEFTYSGTDENGVVWFSGTIPGTYFNPTGIDAVGSERVLVPLILLRSYDSRTNGTRSITCGGRDMGTHRAGNYSIDTEGTAFGFNLLGNGNFFAKTNITVR